MSDSRQHVWTAVAVDGGNGRSFRAQHCTLCKYFVIGYYSMDGESYHSPKYRMIIVKCKDVSKADAEKWMKYYNLKCED